jgi:hypothetical protein
MRQIAEHVEALSFAAEETSASSLEINIGERSGGNGPAVGVLAEASRRTLRAGRTLYRKTIEG